MTPQQIDAIVTLAADYKDACVKARFFAGHPHLSKSMCDQAGTAAIEAKHAYDALVDQIQQASR